MGDFDVISATRIASTVLRISPIVRRSQGLDEGEKRKWRRGKQ